ncbi:class I SAM-dependent methyltransferase [Cupriavidus sp. CV2]|uniref:class I SAM-dependent methyltransferase n=1 Tax=Cupriavidus ulmosensis TaxID=3065913 RepID=UPI00296AFB07|nr:class I SAM-dependent methyltransferase [Cupriavidus sp. CV2]MDW3681742.1 class I SAM-dependent methyltransferase [Cupriavidus sp. CV2]
MVVLPPGTLLQLMYLRERLRRLRPGRFIEIGPGSGEITRLLLDYGWSGRSYDLEAKTIVSLCGRFASEIAEERFVPVHADYLSSEIPEKVDLVISCMVMEHLEDGKQSAFMIKSSECLKQDGVMFALVPGSPEHWGIEDDIAGHCRRYTRAGVERLVRASGWKLVHIAGLTFPVSNLLLPVSNFLVNRSERQKLSLSALERTKQSGRRSVKYKTHFPSMLGLLLNYYTLFPLHILQKLCAGSRRALVLFFEAQPSPGERNT